MDLGCGEMQKYYLQLCVHEEESSIYKYNAHQILIKTSTSLHWYTQQNVKLGDNPQSWPKILLYYSNAICTIERVVKC